MLDLGMEGVAWGPLPWPPPIPPATVLLGGAPPAGLSAREPPAPLPRPAPSSLPPALSALPTAHLSASVVSSLWVTEGHHGRYQQVTLKVAPVGDPRDCQGITLAPN